MNTLSMLMLSLGMGLAGQACAADPVQMREQTEAAKQIQAQERERVYGYELMTPQERLEYQNRMRVLKTEQEKNTFRLQHHKLMQERAKAQGKTLPEMPPAGYGPGMGSGSGMGPGSRR